MNDLPFLPRIIVDTREPPEIQDYLEKEGIEVEIQQLDVGDYVLSENVVVERKRTTDFTASLLDNRLFENLARAKETYPKVILVLEKFGEIFDGPFMNINSIYGALAYCAYKMDISVVPTNSLGHTAIFLKRIAIREQVEDKAPVFARVAPRGMDKKERRKFVIEGLVNTGPAKAAELLRAFKTPARVFSAIKTTRVLYTKTGNPKGIEGPIKDAMKGFGVKWVIDNQKLLFGSKKALQSQLVPDPE